MISVLFSSNGQKLVSTMLTRASTLSNDVLNVTGFLFCAGLTPSHNHAEK